MTREGRNVANAARDFSKYIDHLGFHISEDERLDAGAIADLLDHLEGTKSSMSWALGDLVVYARDSQNDDWMTCLSHRLNLRTLNNYASIARKFPRDRRRPTLSFRHHDAVKGLEPEHADEWLDKAERQELSSDDLRQAIKDVAALERRTVIGHVGSIDKLLRLDMGLSEGYEVKIVYTVVLEAA
jgi:hypothetical protein